MTEAYEFITQRRSIRQFTGEPVEKDKLLTLLRAAMSAPNARNSRPWEFVVVTETATLDRLRAAHPYGNHNGTVGIIVCGHPAIADNPQTSEKNWMLDCSAATENLLIQVAALGLGAVWCGVWPAQDRMEDIGAIVGLPEGCYPLNLIWVGYPAEFKESRTQYDESRVHWGKY